MFSSKTTIKPMKRKPLSMKKLVQYVSYFMKERHKYSNDNHILEGIPASEMKLLRAYLDYIWENPE